MNRPQSDAGFTLVELLVVLVIMPIVIGAIAAAIIISEQDSGVASSRLSDSASAQTISEYYVRDVQGAEYRSPLTRQLALSPIFSSPVNVCVDPSASSPPLVLGLYRPATSLPAVPCCRLATVLTASGRTGRTPSASWCATAATPAEP